MGLPWCVLGCGHGCARCENRTGSRMACYSITPHIRQASFTPYATPRDDLRMTLRAQHRISYVVPRVEFIGVLARVWTRCAARGALGVRSRGARGDTARSCSIIPSRIFVILPGRGETLAEEATPLGATKGVLGRPWVGPWVYPSMGGDKGCYTLTAAPIPIT